VNATIRRPVTCGTSRLRTRRFGHDVNRKIVRLNLAGPAIRCPWPPRPPEKERVSPWASSTQPRTLHYPYPAAARRSRDSYSRIATFRLRARPTRSPLTCDGHVTRVPRPCSQCARRPGCRPTGVRRADQSRYTDQPLVGLPHKLSRSEVTPFVVPAGVAGSGQFFRVAAYFAGGWLPRAECACSSCSRFASLSASIRASNTVSNRTGSRLPRPDSPLWPRAARWWIVQSVDVPACFPARVGLLLDTGATAHAEPDGPLRAELRELARRHARWATPSPGPRAILRYVVGRKKVQRLWREGELRVQRKRAGTSTAPPIAAQAPNSVWGIDFQFDAPLTASLSRSLT